MPAGQIWEVVCPSGILVRQGRTLDSPALDRPLAVGSLVEEQERIGERLRYNRVAGTGYGPDSGWVSIRTKAGQLMIPSEWAAPEQGFTVLSKELPSNEELADLARGNGLQPQKLQNTGAPYVFDRQVNFVDTKSTGLRMSTCLAAMDDCRTDMFTICDQSVDKMREATDPFVELAIELRPAIKKLSRDSAEDGLLYTNPKSRGAVMSWLRCEAQFGWPNFPLRNEETTLYLLGKDRNSKQSEPIARARFTLCFVDETSHTACSGPEWEHDVDRYFAKVKNDHSVRILDTAKLLNLYPVGSGPFTPTKFAKTTWLMSACYSDLWAVLYHAKVPEMLWDLNASIGGDFEKLVEKETDPQAMSMSLPKGMKVGTAYDALCFLEESTKKAVYVLLPKDKIKEDGYTKEAVLVVCANYNWAEAPVDGRSLRSQDLEILAAGSRIAMMDFVAGKEPKATKAVDLSKLKLPTE